MWCTLWHTKWTHTHICVMPFHPYSVFSHIYHASRFVRTDFYHQDFSFCDQIFKKNQRKIGPRGSTSHGCFQKIGVPQNGWFIMENPIKMDDLGGKTHYFWKHPHGDSHWIRHPTKPTWNLRLSISLFSPSGRGMRQVTDGWIEKGWRLFEGSTKMSWGLQIGYFW